MQDYISVEIDEDTVRRVEKIVAPQGLTAEDLIVSFIEYLTDPKTQDEAIEMVKKWIEEEERQKAEEGKIE